MNNAKSNVCCFIGHRKINETDELKSRLYVEIENLILRENVKTFLFGSKSEFNDLCHKTVSELKEKYTFIERIYVRAEFQYIDEAYKRYLLEKFEDTYFPEKIIGAGKTIYVQRNYEMIDKSDYCIFYHDKNYSASSTSGTKIAYDYAIKNEKGIINVFSS